MTPDFESHYLYRLYQGSIKFFLISVRNDKGNFSTSAGIWYLESKFTAHVTKPMEFQGWQVGLEKHTKKYLVIRFRSFDPAPKEHVVFKYFE